MTAGPGCPSRTAQTLRAKAHLAAMIALAAAASGCGREPVRNTAESRDLTSQVTLESWDGRPVVRQLPREGKVTVSAVSGEGQFRVEPRCLTLVIDGAHWSPILPANARLGPGTALAFGPAGVAPGTVYGLENLALDVPMPEHSRAFADRGCPTRFAAFTGIEPLSGPNLPRR